MNLGLNGRSCIVTGGSRGIGRAIALGLANEGGNIAICARNEGPLREVEAEIRERGVNAYAESCDVSDATALAAFLETSREALGGVDVLIHNASAFAVGPDLESWDASLQVDLMAAARACEQVVPWMRDGVGGSIIFISSISGLEATPVPDYGYTAAKAALVASGECDCAWLSRVSGRVWDMARKHQPELYETVRSSIPSGRLGTPEEVADVAVYLASPRARWVTGECIAVDGGQHKAMR